MTKQKGGAMCAKKRGGGKTSGFATAPFFAAGKVVLLLLTELFEFFLFLAVYAKELDGIVAVVP